MDSRSPVPGTVYLVGAGPGDPDLITVRGLKCLRQADVVLYDRLLDPALLDEAPAEARRVFVGKSRGRPGVGQAEIHRLMVAHARRGAVVVRLKGGDPFVFGRGGEEAEALTAAGVPWEVVPAVSSAVGVPARAGIPLTHRRLARGFAVVTGHAAQAGAEPNWRALAAVDTLVVLMGLASLPRITRDLMAAGRSPETPVAVVSRGTLPDERVVVSTLAEVDRRVAEEDLPSPATVVVGEVVRLRARLHEVLPLVEDVPAAATAAPGRTPCAPTPAPGSTPRIPPPTPGRTPCAPAPTPAASF
jgi:uroporphyrin-III C-methyltransferase